MAKIPFGQYMPDVLDLGSQVTRNLRNVIPRADGYGPIKDISAFTQALAGVCRGHFLARDPSSGEVVLFAGTATKLYKLDNSTLAWSDVSLGAGSYSDLSSDAQWTFAQFNSVVVACQKNVAPQEYTIGSSSAFANLAGSPPQAGWVAVIGPFLVLADLLSTPFRVQWSDVNDIIDWSAGSSDFQDMPGGGKVHAVGEWSYGVGLIAQGLNLRRMAFAPGSEEVFQIDKLREDIGIIAPYSLVMAGGMAFFLSSKGFAQMGADGALEHIGEERVDRSFLGLHETNAPAELLSLAYDSSQTQLVMGAASPKRNLYIVVYKSTSGNSGQFDRGFVYHWTLKRWSPLTVSGEHIARSARPGTTLEALDAIAPGAQTISATANNGSGLIRVTVGSTAAWTTGDYKTITGVAGTTEANGSWVITVVNGTTIDLQGSAYANAYVSGGVVGGSVDELPFSLDDVSTASFADTSAFNTSHKLGFFAGDTLEARLETAEASIEGRRTLINGVRPITDAATVYAMSITRKNLNEAATEGTESVMDEDGYCPLLDEGRYARFRTRIPAATVWNHAAGVEGDGMRAGRF